MELLKIRSLFESLEEIADPRIERHKQHRLIDILVIAICAMICSADGWEDIEEFGLAKQEWFETFLELPNGIPSHDQSAGRQADSKQFYDWYFRRFMGGITKREKGMLAL